ncbi:MAG TPA: hypothetical protein VMV98_07435 [Acidobacteriaceae bacterium]|nr:hypothetical protein [Acidobacteriaceae bacterium]
MLNGDSSTLYDDAVEHQPMARSQWYALAMRRWFASILLLLTALLPLQPLIASAQADASLPACCRRNGAHHCMMMATLMLADSGTQSSVRPSPCPLWRIPVSPAVVAVAAAPPSLSSNPAFAEDVVALAPALLLISLARSRSARAPPAAPFSMAIFLA